ncbi:MAG: LamG-like jellyroll fold domain-containing protein [Candidatus Paceibacterota bacterium]|jgi:prepilin-type N-terminal cleavage/methylation domain-containing protein
MFCKFTQNKSADFSRESGFTIIELLVAITIIGILAGFAVVNLSGATASAQLAKSKVFSSTVRSSLLASASAEWLFDDSLGAVALDNWGNPKNNCSFFGSPVWKSGIDCVDGGCLQFGASSYLNCGNGKSLDINGAITVEAWIKFSGIDYSGSTGRLWAIAAKGYPDSTAPNKGWWFTYDNRNNGKGFTYTCFGNSAGGYAGGGNNFGGYTYTFTNGDWYHLTFTVGSSRAKLYINGKQLGATKLLSNLVLSDTSRNLFIGSYSGGPSFQGNMDTVRIYSAALTASVISQRYVAGLDQLLAKRAITKENYQKRLAESGQASIIARQD